MCFVVCFYYNAQLSCGFVISIFSWIFCCCCSLLLPLSLTLPLSLCLSVTLFVCKKLPSVFVCLSVPQFHCPPHLLHPLCPFVRARLSFKFCDAAVAAAAAVGGGFVSFLADLLCPLSPRPLLHLPVVFPLSSSFWVYALCSVSFSYCLIYFVGFYCGRRRVAFCLCVCVCLCVHVVCACVCTNSSYRVVLLLLHWRRRRGCRRRSSLVYRFVPLPSPSLHTASHYHRRHHHHRHHHCPSFVSLPCPLASSTPLTFLKHS